MSPYTIINTILPRAESSDPGSGSDKSEPYDYQGVDPAVAKILIIVAVIFCVGLGLALFAYLFRLLCRYISRHKKNKNQNNQENADVELGEIDNADSAFNIQPLGPGFCLPGETVAANTNASSSAGPSDAPRQANSSGNTGAADNGFEQQQVYGVGADGARWSNISLGNGSTETLVDGRVNNFVRDPAGHGYVSRSSSRANGVHKSQRGRVLSVVNH